MKKIIEYKTVKFEVSVDLDAPAMVGDDKDFYSMTLREQGSSNNILSKLFSSDRANEAEATIKNAAIAYVDGSDQKSLVMEDVLSGLGFTEDSREWSDKHSEPIEETA